MIITKLLRSVLKSTVLEQSILGLDTNISKNGQNTFPEILKKTLLITCYNCSEYYKFDSKGTEVLVIVHKSPIRVLHFLLNWLP